MTLAEALPTILVYEGGKVDDPADTGGRTSNGVTQRTYNAWLRDQKPSQDSRDVWEITPAEIEAIYRTYYWEKIAGDGLAEHSSKLALCVFDGAVNHGVGLSARMLQRVVSATPDGLIGPKTLGLVQSHLALRGEPAVLTDYLKRRCAIYQNIIANNPTQQRFAKGWRNRINSLAIKVGILTVWPNDA